MIFCTILFLAAVIASLVLDVALFYPMLFGLLLFSALALKKGFAPRELCRMAWEKGKPALSIVWILLLIGLLTALLRSCGAIAFCVYYGIRAVPPSLFLLTVFLLTMVLSFVMGTSFGVTGTAGVILMALARSGGVNLAMTAGAVLSGAYFGDRCSYASSCTTLVAIATETTVHGNMKPLLKTVALPVLVTCGVYGILSIQNPITSVDDTLLRSLAEGFALSPLTILPALLMLVLPMWHLSTRKTLTASVLAAALFTIFLQGTSPADTLRFALFGYAPEAGSALSVLAGGGILSMWGVCVIVLLTGLYSGILEGTRMLDPLQQKLDGLTDRIGLFATTALVSTICIMIFCNQSVMVLLDAQLMEPSYRRRGEGKTALAMDIANSGVTVTGLIPWSVGVTVPLSMLGVGMEAIPFAVLLYVIPICYFFTRRYFPLHDCP